MSSHECTARADFDHVLPKSLSLHLAPVRFFQFHKKDPLLCSLNLILRFSFLLSPGFQLLSSPPGWRNCSSPNSLTQIYLLKEAHSRHFSKIYS